MFLLKRLKSPLPLLGVCFITTSLFFYIISQTKLSSPLPGSAVNIRRTDVEELLTQDPLHVAKQKEYKVNLLSRIKKTAKRKLNEIKKMDHDPLGVMVHNSGKIGERTVVGSSYVSDTLIKKGKAGHRIVHLDLKGAPLKIQYLQSLFPLMKSLGATGILVEYEDMFPYWGELERISALNAYKKEDIEVLLKEAEKNGLEFIPLIQTFGHMEFVLKLKEFAHLREVPNYPQVICPTNNKTLPLIKQMVDQILELHPGLNWLHIGADEVFNLGECNRCQTYILRESINKDDLFLRHSVKVAQYIKTSYDVQPIMWDDKFRKIPLQSIISSEIGKYVEVMVWQYNPGILANIGNEIWEKYGEVFNGIWVAGAFKGAALPDSFLSDINERLINTKEWIEVLNLYKGNIAFKGIALTGWQRFDHFAVLCELFPQAIPSLAINLSYLINRKADHTALSNIGKSLGCDSFINMDLKYIEFVNHCNFPGSKVYEVAQRLFMLKKDVKAMLEGSHVRGWITDFNIKHKFASPQLVEQGLQDLSMLLFEFKKLFTDAEIALKEVYDTHTVHEWIETNLEETANKLNALFQARKQLLMQTSWPRRPFQDGFGKEL
ncbi:UNVERIFIED_CONTAM: hypothetical protein GTU68_062600 [Idotea baltica]|nr:hypothetical protein [Idotea baltica]